MIRYVIDGDTVILRDGRHVRLIGIDATELAHDGRPAQPFARAARRALAATVAKAGGRAQLQIGTEREDHYGRTLAYLFTPAGDDVGAELVTEGLATVIAIPPNISRVDCYAALERRARTAQLGLWSPGSPIVVSATTLSADTQGFQIVRGRVDSISRFGSGIRVIVSHSLWVWIRKRDLANFTHSLGALRHRSILVKGWVHDYRGHPEIEVHHPAALVALH